MLLTPTPPDKIHDTLAGVSLSTLKKGFAILPLKLTEKQAHALKILQGAAGQSSISLDGGNPMNRLKNELAILGASASISATLVDMFGQLHMWGVNLKGCKPHFAVMEQGYPEGWMNPAGAHYSIYTGEPEPDEISAIRKQVRTIVNLQGPGPQIPMSQKIFRRMRNDLPPNMQHALLGTRYGAQASKPCITIMALHRKGVSYLPPQCAWHPHHEERLLRPKRLLIVQGFGAPSPFHNMPYHEDENGARWPLWVHDDGNVYFLSPSGELVDPASGEIVTRSPKMLPSAPDAPDNE